VAALREAGLEVARVVTVVDRQAGAEAAFRQAGVEFVALFTRADFGL
jgi:orotate phosphoribosyltransferase